MSCLRSDKCNGGSMNIPEKCFDAWFCWEWTVRRCIPLLLGLVLLVTGGMCRADTPISLLKSWAGYVSFVGTEKTRRTNPNTTNACSVLSSTASSTATLSGVPTGATILNAYLYWAGSGSTADYTVTFEGQSVTASRQYTASSPSGNPYFNGVADVTSIVQAKANPNTTYSLSNLTVASSDSGSYNWCSVEGVLSGWALLVIYSNPADTTFRVLNLYEGFQPYQYDSITLNLSNFQIPTPLGSNTGKHAHITWEGDPTLSGGGEDLTFNGVALTDATNPAGNQFNSASNIAIPPDTTSYGVDFDGYTLSSPVIAAGQTSATTVYSSGQDMVLLSAEIIAVPNTPVADRAITISASGTMARGSNVTYTLNVSNNGPVAETGPITVTDTLPTGLTFVSATGTGWSCGAVGQVVTCTRSGTLASGASAGAITLVATVATTATGTLTNTATVSGQLFDNVSSNNTATDSQAVASADLAIAISRGAALVPGTNGTYTITVTNNGPLSDSAVTVSDTLPANLSYESATGSNWTCDATVTCSYSGTLASGATAPAITLTVAVAPGASGTITNTVTVAGGQYDATSSNNTASDSYSLGTALYAYYPMDEISWGSVTDSSGNGRTGTLLSGTTATATNYSILSSPTKPPTPPGAALTGTPGTCGAGLFPTQAGPSGVDTGVDVDSIGSAGTIAFWYSSSASWNDGNNRLLLDASNNLGNSGADKHFYVVKETDGRIRFVLENSGNNNYEAVSGTNSYGANTWHHIAVTWDFASNDRIRLYIDGTQVSSTNVSGSVGNWATLAVGGQRMTGVTGTGSTYTSNSAYGYIDEVRIYTAELTTASSPSIATVKNYTHPCGPVMSIANASTNEGNSGTTILNFPVTLDVAAPTNVTASYATTAGTATAGASCSAGVDYVTASGTVTVLANATTATIPITLCGDTTYETNETFTVTLSSPSGVRLQTSATTATGTIVNDDTQPSITVVNTASNEGNSGTSTVNVPVALSNASYQTVTVNYVTANGTAIGGASCASGVDYVTSSGTLSIAPGATSATIPVTICGDTDYEAHETFTVTISAPTNGTLGATTSATVTIVNDEAFAWYKMDESSWTGTSGEVKDGSGANLGYNATRYGLATTDGTSPLAYGDNTSGTCRYGRFDLTGTPNAYVQLPAVVRDLFTSSFSFTVTAWLRSSDISKVGQRILVRDDNSNGWAFSFSDEVAGTMRIFNRSVVFQSASLSGGGAIRAGGVALDTPAVFSNNTWYFVALAVDVNGKTATLYVYNSSGTQLAKTSATYTGTWAAGTGELAIGNETSASGENGLYFKGNIDEVTLLNSAADQTVIESLRTRSRTCTSLLGSFSVTAPTSASTCGRYPVLTNPSPPPATFPLPPVITITARDSGGGLLSSYIGTVNLSTSSGRGSWAKPASANGTLTNNSGGTGTYTFAAADAGSVNLYLIDDVADTLTVTAVDSSDSSKNGTSGTVTYSTNAFVLTEDSIQVAGKPQAMTIALWSQDSGKNCAVASNYTGSKPLKVWLTPDPTYDPGGDRPTINGQTLGSSTPLTDNLSGVNALTFSAGVAAFTLNTTDVGAYSLNVRDSTMFGGSPTFNGSSNVLRVRPFAVVVDCLKQGGAASTAASCPTDGVDNPGTNVPSGVVFAKAGTAFEARLGGYLWSSTADADNDGLPDSGATMANVKAGGLAAKFAHGVTLAAAVPFYPATASDTPAGTGVAGSLANGAVAVTGGSTTATTLSYSEVGAFTLTATPASNYLGSADLSSRVVLEAVRGTRCSGGACVVGRFTPDHFSLTPTSVSAACTTHPAATPGYVPTDFTYFGQDGFRTVFSVTARNKADNTTGNYAGACTTTGCTDWARMPMDDWPAWGFVVGSWAPAQPGGTPAAAIGAGVVNGIAWVNGVAAGVEARHVVSRPATFALGTAYPAPTTIAVTAMPTDQDGVTVASAQTVGSSILLRYGRLRLSNGYGSERLPLMPQSPQLGQIEYFDGSSWRRNQDDSCTTFAALGGIASDTVPLLSMVDGSSTGSSVALRCGAASNGSCGENSTYHCAAARAISGGNLSICFATPNVRGYADFSFSLAGAPYLDFPSVAHNRSARASFGIYSSGSIGRNKVIYRRERY